MTPARRHLLLLMAVSIPACETFKEPVSSIDPELGDGDVFLGEAGGSAGGTGAGAGCPLYKGPQVHPGVPWHPALYFWASEAELTRMRSEKNIFEPPSDQVGGDPLEKLRSLVHDRAQDDAAVLQEITKVTEVREAWPYPWANRFTLEEDPAGHERAIPVRVVLRENAWIAAYHKDLLRVYSKDQGIISSAEAAAHAENIAAVYLARDPEDVGADQCGGEFSFTSSSALRSFVLLQPSMIQRWEVGSNEIAARLESDSIALQDFLVDVRGKWLGLTANNFANEAACAWELFPNGCSAEYLMALGSSGVAYVPDAANLAALITALDETILDQKFQVLSPSLPDGMGGAGGAPDDGGGF